MCHVIHSAGHHLQRKHLRELHRRTAGHQLKYGRSDLVAGEEERSVSHVQRTDRRTELDFWIVHEWAERGIPVEVSNSLNACSLYNLLCAEREGEGIILFSRRLTQPRYVFDPHNVHALQNTASAGERKRIQLSKQANKSVPAMAHPKYNK